MLNPSMRSSSDQRPRLEMNVRQVLNSVPRVAQNLPVAGAKRSEITVLEITERAQNLRRLATEHLAEGTQANWQGYTRGNHFGDVPIILGLRSIQRCLEFGRHQVVQRRDQ